MLNNYAIINNDTILPRMCLRIRKTLWFVIREINARTRHFSLARHNISIVGCLFSGSLKERRLILEKAFPNGVCCKSSRATFPTRICGYSRTNTADIRDNNGNSVSSSRSYSRVPLFTAFVHVHVFRPNDQKSLGRPIVYAGVHTSRASFSKLL